MDLQKLWAEKPLNRRQLLQGPGLVGGMLVASKAWETPVGGILPIVNIKADPQGEDVKVSDILSLTEPHKETGVRVQFSGHIKLSEDLEFSGYQHSQFVGVGRAIIEQQNADAEITPLGLTACEHISVSDLELRGEGIHRRSDGEVPQQSGLRIIGSSFIHIERCFFGPMSDGGTIQHAVNIQENSHHIWVRENRMQRTTAAAVIVWSGVDPHPTDFAKFTVHNRCNYIWIEDNHMEYVGGGIAIDDATVGSWVLRNRIDTHYGHGIVVEDGSSWFEVAGNFCGPGRGAAVVIGGGQSETGASRGVVTNNMASGCNDSTLVAPPDFLWFNREDSAFHVTAHSWWAVSGGSIKFGDNLDAPY